MSVYTQIYDLLTDYSEGEDCAEETQLFLQKLVEIMDWTPPSQGG